MTKLLPFLIAICLFNSVASSAEKSSELYLKNGKTIELDIKMVYQRHLVDSDGKGILLRQIDSLYTRQQPMVQLFSNLDSSIMVTEYNGGYIINLMRYVPPAHYSEPRQLLTPQSVALYYRYDSYGNIGFHYDGIILENLKLIHRFQSSLAINPQHKVMTNLNFAFGAGYKNEFNRLTGSCVVNFGLYGGFIDNGQKPGMQKVSFVSSNIGYQLSELLNVNSGFDYFVYRENDAVPNNNFIFYIGVTMRLK